MTFSEADLQMGMIVKSSDGDKLGTLNEVIEEPGDGTMYLVVEGGFFGLGSPSLYVPASAVARIEAGNNIILDCDEAEAKAKYKSKPSH